MSQSQTKLDTTRTDTESDGYPTKSEQVRAELPPEKLLKTSKGDLIWAAIRMIDDMETLRTYIGYENAHQNRTGILQMMANRADVIRSEGA